MGEKIGKGIYDAFEKKFNFKKSGETDFGKKMLLFVGEYKLKEVALAAAAAAGVKFEDKVGASSCICFSTSTCKCERPYMYACVE